MKRQTIRLQAFLVMLPLFLLPFLASPIFYLTAQHYAREAAARSLRAVHRDIVSILEASQAEVKPADSVKLFFDRTDLYMTCSASDANLLVFSRDFRIMYPRDKDLQTALQPLAESFAASIQSRKADSFTRVEAADNTAFMAIFFSPDAGSESIGHIVTFCPDAKAGQWVGAATWVFVSISVIGVAISLSLIGDSLRRIHRSLRQLGQEAARIGSGDYSPVKQSFSLQEMEDLRLSMNAMAAQLQQAKDTQQDFFAGITHDLRSPLVSIGGYAQGIACGVFSPPDEAAQRIMDESKRMTELLDRMAVLTQLDSYLSGVKGSSLDVAEAAEDCLDNVRDTAAQRGVALRLCTDDTALRAQGDAEQFHAVLDNLLSNALRYAKTEVEVAVRAEGEQLLITVADDGDGIAEEDLPRIFQRFFKGPGGEHGLGLAIAWNAAEHMGGSLTAANRPGGGAVFTLRLPRKD